MGTYTSFLLLSLVILVNGSISLAASYKKSENKVSSATSQTIRISLDPNDVIAAKKISFLLDNFQRKGAERWAVLEIIQILKQGGPFSHYFKTFEKILTVLDAPTLKKVSQVCTIEDVASAQIKRPEGVLAHTCFQKTLKIVATAGGKSKMGIEDKKFLSVVLSAAVRDGQFGQLSQFLENIEKDKKFHREISNILDELFISLKVEVPQSILRKIEISSALTTHIQNQGLSIKDTQEVFFHELKQLSTNLVDILGEKNVSKEYVKSAVERIRNYYQLNADNLPQDKTWRVLNSVGKTLLSKHFYIESEQIYLLAHKASPADNTNESLFNLFWVFLMKENYDEAMTFVKKYSLLENFSTLSSSIQFWTAFTFEQNGQKRKAMELYQKVVENFGFDFYSIFSAKRFLELGGPRDRLENQLKSFVRDSSISGSIGVKDFNEEYVSSLKRVMLWARFNEMDMLDGEVSSLLEETRIFKHKSKHSSLSANAIKELSTLMIANALSANGQYLLSFSIIQSNIGQEGLSPNKDLLQSLFPAPYFQQISEFQDEVDPILVLSLIRQESGFNPKARSRVGARGLMQLMPATARQIQRKVATGQLDHPETNLKIGIKYFKKLFSKYSGNLVYTLAAYNAGERNLQRWTDNIFRSESLLHTIESIPYNETRKYVKLIIRNIFFYRFLQTQSLDGENLAKIFDLGLPMPTKGN